MSHRKYDLGRDGIWTLVLSLALPTALAQAVNVLYAIIDRMFIGHIAGYGDIALAGVGVAAPIATFISSFATLIGMGGAPLMAMSEGHGDHEKAERIVTTGFYLLIISSALLTPVFFFFRDPILLAFGASPVTLPYASEYLGWYLLGTPFALLAGGLNSFVINQGMSRKGMASVLTGAVLNIMLDPLFIFTFSMGVKGAAIATVLSQLASMCVSIMALRGSDATIKLRFRGFMPGMIKKIIKLGLSSFIILSTDSLLLIVLTAMLQKYGGPELGDTLITCSTIVQSYHILVTYPMNGMTAGCQGLVSYNYGAGDMGRVKRIFTVVLIMCAVIMLAGTILSAAFPASLVGIFTENPDTIRIGVTALRTICIGFIFSSVSVASSGALEGLGKGISSLMISLLRYIVVIIPVAFLLCFVLGMGPDGVWSAFWITEIIAAAASIAIYRKSMRQ